MTFLPMWVYTHTRIHIQTCKPIKNRGTKINRNILSPPLECNFHEGRQYLVDLFSLVSPDREQYLVQYMLNKRLMLLLINHRLFPNSFF